MTQVLSYEVHTNVVDHHSFMLKLKNFCQTQGWTVQTWEPNKIWAFLGGGLYGWSVGTEDFLEVRSVGFGAQTMQFRLRLEDTGTLNNRWLQLGAFYGTLAYDFTNATHPVTRAAGAITNWNSYRYFGLSSDAMPAVWFFGNEKVIFWVVKYDLTYAQISGFGSVELNDTAETQGFWAGAIQNSNVYEWYDKQVIPACDWRDYCVRWNSTSLYSPTLINYSDTFNIGKYSASSVAFFSLGGNLLTNQYASIRPIFQQDIWVKDIDNKWLALGRHWPARIQHDGLKIGEELTYGTEKYLCFPFRVLDVDTSGYAFRIA